MVGTQSDVRASDIGTDAIRESDQVMPPPRRRPALKGGSKPNKAP